MRSIALSLHIKDLGLIDESVDDGVGNGIVRKDLIELPERDVGGCNGPQLRVMSGADHLEKQVAGLSVQRHVSQLVNDEHLRLAVAV